MHNAKELSEFHFDTEKSGCILRSFLADAKISNAVAAKLLGYSYDTINDTLRGKNKESKMDIVVKVCAISGHTLKEWCERMLDGVNEEVADMVRVAFGIPIGGMDAAIDNIEVVAVPQPVPVVATPGGDEASLSRMDLDVFVARWSEAQERTMDRYKGLHQATYEELRVGRDLLRQQYENQIEAMKQTHDKERRVDEEHFAEERRTAERHFEFERDAYQQIIKRLEEENARLYKRNRNLAAIISNKKVTIDP